MPRSLHLVRTRRAAALAALAGLAFSALALDGPVPPARSLHLRTGDVPVSSLPNRLLDPAPLAPSIPYVLLLDGPMTPSRRAALAAAGASIDSYLPTDAFLITAPNVDPAALRALPFVLACAEFSRDWKIAPSARAALRAAWQTPDFIALQQSGRVALRVWMFPGQDPAPVRDLVRTTANAEILADESLLNARSMSLILPANALDALADIPAVQCVEPLPEYTERSNSTTRWVVQSNQVGVTPFYARGITGSGHVLGLIDSRVAVNHCSFLDPLNPIGPAHRKIVAYHTSLGSSSHGTHVAATAVGDNGDNSDTRGVAYAARMAFNIHPNLSDEQSMFDRLLTHHDDGARVHSNSWGTDAFRDYDGGCRAIDAFSHQFEDDLVLFAVTDNMPTVMNPENAKNCVAVYATSNNPNQHLWCFGGAAPTSDGRRKPEVGAPGCSISSASGSSGCATGINSGTSMATPAVAGLAVLLRDYFLQGFYPSGEASPSDAFSPSGSLLRAMLTNSSVDLTGQPGFPSVREGWGRVLADNAAFFAADARRLVLRDIRTSSPDSLETGQQTAFEIDVQPGQPLKVTLAYADFPADVSASFTPVNNLDLVATSPSGVVYRGNFFANGESSPGGSADPLNNLEQVLLSAPEPGAWSIAVVGAAVNMGPQGFALVISGAVSELSCQPDYNQDGVADQDDVAFLIAVIAGAPNPGGIDPDFNRDGVADQDDVSLLIDVIAGGDCR